MPVIIFLYYEFSRSVETALSMETHNIKSLTNYIKTTQKVIFVVSIHNGQANSKYI